MNKTTKSGNQTVTHKLDQTYIWSIDVLAARK